MEIEIYTHTYTAVVYEKLLIARICTLSQLFVQMWNIVSHRGNKNNHADVPCALSWCLSSLTFFSFSRLTPPVAREDWKSAGRTSEKEKDAGKKRALPKRDPLPQVKSAEWKNRTSDGLITDSAYELLNLQLLRRSRAHLAQAESKKLPDWLGDALTK